MNTSNIINREYKCLDHGFIRVVDVMGTDSSIVQAARVSYGAGTKTSSSDAGLINFLMRMRHTSPFEMCEIKLHIKLPIFIARQWIRHRTASVSEVSARYSIVGTDFYLPDHLYKQSNINKQCSSNETIPNESELLEQMKQCSIAAITQYNKLIDSGVSREIARIILPLNMYTEWYWKIDLHNLLHFLQLRMASDAQNEIRVYADAILNMVKDWVPLTHFAFLNYRVNSICISSAGVDVVRNSIPKDCEFHSEKMSQRELNELQNLFGHN